MKIPQRLPQFEDRSLLIVSGQFVAHFYIAYKGQIRLVGELVVKDILPAKPGESSRISGRHPSLGKGAFHDAHKKKIHQDYLKDVKKAVKDKMKSYRVRYIYLYAPSIIVQDLIATLPRLAQDLIQGTFRGNFNHSGPLELVEKIGKEKSKKVRRAKRAMAKPEAKKILNKGKKS